MYLCGPASSIYYSFEINGWILFCSTCVAKKRLKNDLEPYLMLCSFFFVERFLRLFNTHNRKCNYENFGLSNIHLFKRKTACKNNYRDNFVFILEHFKFCSTLYHFDILLSTYKVYFPYWFPFCSYHFFFYISSFRTFFLKN